MEEGRSSEPDTEDPRGKVGNRERRRVESFRDVISLDRFNDS